jgi:uncharacterized protein (DUF58 family)
MRSGSFPRSLRPTREGWAFLAFTFLLGLAALNSGNNLLYLTVALLLSLIVLSGLLSEQGFRKVRLTVHLPRRCFAGTPAQIRVAVRNGKRRLPSYALEVRLAGEAGGGRLLRLGAGETAAVTLSPRFARRGLHLLPALRLATRYPFGLFLKSAPAAPARPILIYPALGSPPAAPPDAGDAQEAARRRGTGGELFDLRPYRAGEDMRLIHWRITAKAGRLMLRETAAETGGRLTLVLEQAPGATPEGVEADVSRAAAAATAACARGAAVRLLAGRRQVPWGTGERHADRILRELALLDPAHDGLPGPRETGLPGDAAGTLRLVLGAGLPAGVAGGEE